MYRDGYTERIKRLFGELLKLVIVKLVVDLVCRLFDDQL